MRFGLFTTCLHDRDLGGALQVIENLGLASVELISGGYFPAPHLHMDALEVSKDARDELLGTLRNRGAELTALNTSGNPLHPDASIRSRHAADIRRSIDVAAELSVPVVVVQSGNPGAEPGATLPSWVVSPWDSAYTDVLDYQWSLAKKFWRQAAAHAETRGIRLAVEMHPHQLVYNPPTLERLIETVDSEAIGVEMDPSHLFWQGIDPVGTVRRFGDRVFIAAAKDTLIHEENTRRNGYLNNLWQRDTHADAMSLGGKFVLNQPPADPSYEFVAIGKGHETAFWSDWLTALHEVNPDIAVNIEHEDLELGPVDGVTHALEHLRAAAAKAGIEPVATKTQA